MWLMLQQEQPDDYVVATGLSHSVKDLIQVAFDHLELDWKKHVISEPKLFRPAEVDHLLGDPTKAKKKLGWQPKRSFEELIGKMVDHDVQLNQKVKRDET
jgi:GDPmannose 4,6-dehydratase